MNYITQTELDALAAAANQVLLPLVNAATTLEAQLANPYYDKMSGVPIDGVGATPIIPQPPYSFAAVPYQNLIPHGATYDADGNYWVSIPWSGDYNYQQGANDLNLHDPANGGSDYGVSLTNFYLLATADAITLTGVPGALVTAVFTESPSALLKELNRIRGDAMAVVLGDNPSTSSLFLNPAAVCSGPWVVGVNEPATWNVSAWPTAGSGPGAGQGPGILGAGLAVDGTRIGSFCLFDEVWFVTQNDSVSVASQGVVDTTIATATVWTSLTGAYWGEVVGTLKLRNAMPGHLKLTVTMSYTINNINAGVTPPAASAVGFSVSPSFGDLTLTDPTDRSTAIYQFTGTYEADIDAGEIDFVFTFHTPATWGLLENSGNTWAPGYGSLSAATVTGTLTATDNPALSPGYAAVTPQAGAIYCHRTESLIAACYLDNGTNQCYFYPQFMLSAPTVPGVWVAKTLPVPGINVFIDQDIPPHIGAMATIAPNFTPQPVAVSGAGQMDGTVAAPYASAMRQAVPVQLGTPDVTTVGKVHAAKPGITTRPAKWLVRRDSDFVPYDLGFNNRYGNYVSTVYAGQVLGPAGIAYYNMAVQANATKVRIYLVKPGTTPGWYGNNGNNGNNAFSYGLPVGSELDILVEQASYPELPDNYDFLATDNFVVIDGTVGSGDNWYHPNGSPAIDISAGYLDKVKGSGFDFAVVNPGTVPVTFDVYVQVETGTPTRVYTPPCAECYSYVIDGTPGMYAGLGAPWYGSSGPKPIPQSGYCLFRARASRIPMETSSGIAVTPSSGPALTVTLGQNVINEDGSLSFQPFVVGGKNLTLTIPATSGTSGDVAIFIPVLAATEVIYQCSQQIILEVWANWQPLWFNAMYQLGEFPYTGDLSTTIEAQWPRTTAFRTALSFANDFIVSLAGWVPPYYSPDIGSAYNRALGSVAVWPLFRELYDDTVTLLGLVGATLPGGSTDAGGGGGAGGTGGFGAL